MIMKIKALSLLSLILFLLFLESMHAEEYTIIGLSPVNQNVCLSKDDIKTIYFTVSTNSSESRKFSFYILDLNWIYVNDSITIPARTVAQIPFYIAPKNVSEGGIYSTRIWVCTTKEQTNFSGQVITGCLEGNITVGISEKCRINKKDYTSYFLLIIIPAMIAMLFFSYRKRLGK